MSVVRAPRAESQFVQLRNEVVRDKRLSFKARGVLAWILSQPDNWRTDADMLSREGLEGRDAIRSALKELRVAGYVVQTKRQNDRGRWITETLVYDTPQEAAGQTEVGIPAVGNPDVGQSDAVRTPTTNNHEEVGSSDPWACQPDARSGDKTTTNGTSGPRWDEAQWKRMNEDFARLRALCHQVGETNPVDVYWTLFHEHGAKHPDGFMTKLVEAGTWDGFVGRHGINEYKPNGAPA